MCAPVDVFAFGVVCFISVSFNKLPFYKKNHMNRSNRLVFLRTKIDEPFYMFIFSFNFYNIAKIEILR